MYDDQDGLNADATGVEEQQDCIEGYDMHCPTATHIAHLDSAREQRRPPYLDLSHNIKKERIQWMYGYRGKIWKQIDDYFLQNENIKY